MPRPRRTALLFVFALAVALITLAARWFVTSASEFSHYDDEGFVMLMLRHYMAGDVLYSEFYAQYGPFAYQVLAAAHRLLGMAPSNDSARIVSLLVYAATLAVWVAVALQVLRNRAVVVLFLLAIGQLLLTTSLEPGHPQDIGALLIAMSAGSALLQRTAATERGRTMAAIATGIAAAALLLTKLNVGLFVIIALLFMAPLERYGWRVARFGLLLLPALLMHHRLELEWVRNFCLIETAGLLLFLTATRDPSGATVPSIAPWVRGACATAALILGIELLHGATAYGLVDGIVLQHLQYPLQVFQEGFIASDALYATAISVVLFVLVQAMRAQPWSAGVVDAAKLIVGAGGLACAIGFGVYYLVAFGVAFVWLLVSPRVDRGWMMFMAALALLMPLQAYPVAGSQFYIGAVPMAFLCALAFDDVVNRSRSRVIELALVLLAVMGPVYQLRALHQGATAYAELQPLALPGASLLRLPAETVAEYQGLAQRVKQFDTFVSHPGLLSLYLWTETTPPTKWNAGNWMRLLRPDQQNDIITALQRAHHPGAVVHLRRSAFFTEHRVELSSPLAGYLDRACTTTETLGEWQVRSCAPAAVSAVGDRAPARSN